jgi:hypothetical protein
VSARRDSLPDPWRVGEKSSVTDEPPRPSPEEAPGAPKQPEPRKRSTTRGRDWQRAARVTSGTAASPAVTKIIVRVAIAVALLGALVMVVQRTGIPLLKEPEVVRPARNADDPQEAKEWRDFATQHFGEEIHDVVDDRDFEPEPQWRRALEVTAGLDDALIAKNVRFDLSRHFDEVMKDPAAFRGQFVHMRGVVWKSFRAFKLFDPIAGRGDFYRGQISDDDPDSPVVFFDLLDRPADFEKDDYETVEMDAVFYRMVEFEPTKLLEGEKKGVTRRAPWLIAKTFRVVKAPPHPTIPTAVGIAVIVAFLALFFGIVYLVRRGSARKTSGVPEAGFRHMFEQRRQRPPLTEGEEPPGL